MSIMTFQPSFPSYRSLSRRFRRKTSRPLAARPSLVEIMETRTLLSGSVAFSAPQEFDVGSNPLSVVVADFNGDGKLDMASANYFSNDVSVLLGNGDGTFQAQRSAAAGNNPYALVAADFNGDGKADLAVTHINNTNPSLSVLLGNGDGSFQAPLTVGAQLSVISVAVGDFNSDGKADLALSGRHAGVLLGNGDGTFQALRTVNTEQGVTSVAVADFNGDGKADLAMGGTGVGVCLGNGDGTFQAENHYGYESTLSIAVGDFNGDGRADLVAATADFYTNDNVVARVQLGNGDGTFQSERDVFGYQTFVESLAVGDFDGDGKTDVALGYSGVSVHTGNGDGTFENYVTPVGYQAGEMRSIATGDFNGDGRLDIAFVDQIHNKLGVMLNLSPAQQAQNLTSQIQALVAAGTLKQAVANSLLVKLTNVAGPGGVGRVTAFINQVQAMLKSGKLDPTDCYLLLGMADTLLGSLT